LNKGGLLKKTGSRGQAYQKAKEMQYTKFPPAILLRCMSLERTVGLVALAGIFIIIIIVI